MAISLQEQLAEWLSGVIPGLRFGAAAPGLAVLHHFDHILLDRDTAWQLAHPAVVMQLGGRVTSKRVQSFLEHCALVETSTVSR